MTTGESQTLYVGLVIIVALLAGVSAATVSRSLRGHSNVAPLTRQRVVEAARELGYVVSPHASGLASGRTWTVGVGASDVVSSVAASAAGVALPAG